MAKSHQTVVCINIFKLSTKKINNIKVLLKNVKALDALILDLCQVVDALFW